MNREIEVWANWWSLGKASLMGILRAEETRGKEVFSFEYDRSWLGRGLATQLDPELQFLEGPQYLDAARRPNFGLFLDSSPDRWGRVLMQRREAVFAREQSRREKRLSELDYLLGVHDAQRLGALRFREIGRKNEWLSDDPSMGIPPWASLRELERASWELQQADRGTGTKIANWLSLLIAPGSSLGGARPKAGVVDEFGYLWIAKFPGRNDRRDVAAWEIVAHRLARKAGVSMADARLKNFGNSNSTFLTRRFDRVVENGIRKRVHFASAMTLLGYNDGDGSESGVSYLELAEWLIRHGALPDEDLPQLWKRIVFSIAIRNTDDHLRNHGFLLTEKGWRLSPAYDINPDPDGRGLSLNVSETDNSLSFDLALKVATYFRLSALDATTVVKHVRKAVADWREEADHFNIRKSEQDRMAAAFERHED
ncbi:MAG: HipA domain-containing protein [Verrucomicrobiota bacterium]